MDLRIGDESVTDAGMLVSIKARGKEYEEFLPDLDNQVCKEMSGEWQRYLVGKEESLAVRSKDVPNI